KRPSRNAMSFSGPLTSSPSQASIRSISALASSRVSAIFALYARIFRRAQFALSGLSILNRSGAAFSISANSCSISLFMVYLLTIDSTNYLRVFLPLALHLPHQGLVIAIACPAVAHTVEQPVLYF